MVVRTAARPLCARGCLAVLVEQPGYGKPSLHRGFREARLQPARRGAELPDTRQTQPRHRPAPDSYISKATAVLTRL